MQKPGALGEIYGSEKIPTASVQIRVQELPKDKFGNYKGIKDMTPEERLEADKPADPYSRAFYSNVFFQFDDNVEQVIFDERNKKTYSTVQNSFNALSNMKFREKTFEKAIKKKFKIKDLKQLIQDQV